MNRAISAENAAAQAIARANQDLTNSILRAQLDADRQLYEQNTRNLQNRANNIKDQLNLNNVYLQAFLATLSGTASDYQRIISEQFSPEKFLKTLSDSVTVAAETLANERSRLEQLMTSGAAREEVVAQQQRVIEATRAHAQAAREAAQAQAELNQRLREASFGGQFARAMTQNARGLAALAEYSGGLAAKGLNTFSDALWTAMEAVKNTENVEEALSKMLSATLQSIGQEATVRALMETAAGFAALATPATAPMAPGHFAAAAVYASVAALAGAGYMALPTPPSKKEKEKESEERDLLRAGRHEPHIVINGTAFMTKEELSKAVKKIMEHGSSW